MAKRFLKNITLTLGFLVAALGSYYALNRTNIHTVIPHKIYRSAQLGESKLSHLLDSEHIKSVLNLRGAHPKKPWYQDEIKATFEAGAKHYDLALNAHKIPTTEKMNKLIHLLQTGPYPMLIHCKAGADRTGLASGLALLLNGHSVSSAKHQSSLTYFVTATDSVGKQVFGRYQKWLKARHLKHSQSVMKMWLAEEAFKEKEAA